jgi:carbon starvation protein
MKRTLIIVVWTGVSLTAAAALGVIALRRGETINAAWLVTAAIGSYAVAYRFYSRFIATRVLGIDPRRATPAIRLANGRDFVATSRWVLYGHHFAAIAGAGPLIGPVLAAQFGYLPGTLWIIVGVILGGAVQDFVILFASMRRDGKSLGQMAKEEVNGVAGLAAMVAILAIMVILLAVLALVVVRALMDSPWGMFTIACTIPIALMMGYWMKVWRPGKTVEASLAGAALLILALIGGRWVAESAALAPLFTYDGLTIAWLIIGYGFVASVLPVWVLLCPRDYLSTFLKIGTVLALAAGILIALPPIKLPAVTEFVDGTGPVFAGKLFPFAFITIACGAISGFHSLVASGTTPKMVAREEDARVIGYGGMLMESFVGIMAMTAAAILDPGVYFAINTTVPLNQISEWGFVVTPDQMDGLARQMGEATLIGRTGGAASLAVGMATIFAGALGQTLTALWYHFAIMFEALFILTTVDTGTRVGRFMFQELAGQLWAPLGRTSWYPSVLVATVGVVAGWGYFLIQGVLDPLGGINSLWPLFGISNQLLAAVALTVATTIIVKMGRARYLWVTAVPLVWLVSTTLTAGWQKVFSPDPKLGFLAHAASLDPAAPSAARLAFNDRLNAVVALVFMAVVVVVLATAVWEWYLLLRRRKTPVLCEAPYVDIAAVQPSPAS